MVKSVYFQYVQVIPLLLQLNSARGSPPLFHPLTARPAPPTQQRLRPPSFQPPGSQQGHWAKASTALQPQ